MVDGQTLVIKQACRTADANDLHRLNQLKWRVDVKLRAYQCRTNELSGWSRGGPVAKDANLSTRHIHRYNIINELIFSISLYMIVTIVTGSHRLKDLITV